MNTTTGRVVVGMDPHKRSATIEVMTAEETLVGGDRFATDRDGYAEMRRYAGQWPDRVWSIEGCAGIGKHIAVRLLADGEQVVDVPPKLSARARVFVTGQQAYYDRKKADGKAPMEAMRCVKRRLSDIAFPGHAQRRRPHHRDDDEDGPGRTTGKRL